MDVNNNSKGEVNGKRITVSPLGVVERVEERPPARDPERNNPRKAKPRRKQNVGMNSKEFKQQNRGKEHEVERQENANRGISSNNTNRYRDSSKSDSKEKGTFHYLIIILSLVFAFRILTNSFNRDDNGENIAFSILPETEGVASDSILDTILSILGFLYSIVEGVFKLIWGLITTILGL